MKTRLRQYAVLLLVVGASLGVAGCSKQPAPVEDVRPVRVMRIEPETATIRAEFSGDVRPRIESRLGFRVGGKIIARKVDVGATVKRGQLLMQLDPQDLRLARTQAEAALRAAQSNRDLARAELARYSELRARNFVSQAVLDAKQTAFRAAQSSFDQAQAAYRSQANQAGYADLVADADGVVTAVDAEVGQVVAPGSPVVRVARSGDMEVAIGIPEDKVDALRALSDIRVRTWAHPDEIMQGRLRELAPVADPATRTYEARIAIPDRPDVKLGMTAYVSFAAPSAAPVIKLPLTALFKAPEGSAVWVVEQGRVRQAPVTIAGVDGNEVIAAGGLQPGQQVVTAGVHLLQPGQKVKILGATAAAERTRDAHVGSIAGAAR